MDEKSESNESTFVKKRRFRKIPGNFRGRGITQQTQSSEKSTINSLINKKSS